MKYVRITKMAAVPGGALPESTEEHVYGRIPLKDKSLPIDYTVEGFLVRPPEVGCAVLVDRRRRNGVEADGYFQSSRVTQVDEDGFSTKNSVYRMEEIPEP